ncbi:hypothetical protein SUNI508_12957 [Seiridium unicorne]|uniref:Uncharacterized protein n=1 Tax=Seiridium unicorne TaxID=138068 RepID=A0ABR2VG34_9PEZI
MEIHEPDFLKCALIIVNSTCRIVLYLTASFGNFFDPMLPAASENNPSEALIFTNINPRTPNILPKHFKNTSPTSIQHCNRGVLPSHWKKKSAPKHISRVCREIRRKIMPYRGQRMERITTRIC